MTTNNKEAILKSLFLTMKPMAEIMLMAGIGHKEAVEAMKLAMVDVARSKYGIRDRPTNTSRIAVMTGMTRKEIKRVREDLEKGGFGDSGRCAPGLLVLNGWQTEKEFLNEHGQPADLPFKGERGSFTSLVRQFGGDLPPGAVRTELLRMGCVMKREDDWLIYVGLNAVSAHFANAVAEQLEQIAVPLLESIAVKNSESEGGLDDRVRERVGAVVRAADVERLKSVWAERLGELVQSFEKMMEGYALLHGNDVRAADPREVTVGAYFYDVPAATTPDSN